MTIQYDTHTFVIRVAPEQSAYAGQVCAEIRCDHRFKAIQPLKQLGIQAEILETWVHPQLGWKLLRFRASLDAYLKLEAACKPADVESIALESESHIAAEIRTACEILTQQLSEPLVLAI